MLSASFRTSSRLIIRPLSTSTIKFQNTTQKLASEPVDAAEEVTKQDQSWNDLYAENFQGTNLQEDEVVFTPLSVQEQEPPVQISNEFTRKFPHGHTYNPFHFSMDRLHMERGMRSTQREDPFERCGMNPRNLYMMPEVLSKFITSTGQILPRSKTGCSAKNQKLLSNAIKTARSIGVLSSVHRHHRHMPQRNF
ncbi:uncharacterized protein SPAPADRAFT_58153 [Spathaspora passalidarum NRRL Y-27907]|uniref:Small ribosomal subunit protein bS18m n=1 Tax=Spathaspora passalidarum (strain NRRL Y-27907 / 11-Y1) TaxID=619300 RepID=G3AFN0_SPAPN|nr:uncharacterized protein SPAPADRAFT_58153 [Spathaspora passalidarum NRRL Y-27907]EGW35019.1 hypothetical protein SPAPADRAFT_58153 [Spathaspora passalidarum NRRL Y-27907]